MVAPNTQHHTIAEGDRDADANTNTVAAVGGSEYRTGDKND